MAETIGNGPCLNCQATVAYKLTVAGAVFFRCEGHVDPERRACGFKVMGFGALDSANIKKHFKKADHVVTSGKTAGLNKPASIDAPVTEIGAAKPKGKAKPAPDDGTGTAKPSGGGFGNFYD
tara:strand:- start:7194 stop:7559 length:366 start_codon:yes stop_codon:yes gene_type:complete